MALQIRREAEGQEIVQSSSSPVEDEVAAAAAGAAAAPEQEAGGEGVAEAVQPPLTQQMSGQDLPQTSSQVAVDTAAAFMQMPALPQLLEAARPGRTAGMNAPQEGAPEYPTDEEGLSPLHRGR